MLTKIYECVIIILPRNKLNECGKAILRLSYHIYDKYVMSKFSVPKSAVCLQYLDRVEYVVALFCMPGCFTALYQFPSLHVDE
jgi:hypothetical protein